MKYWKPINSLAICCLSVLMLSCTTENAVVGNVGISDVKSSGCKASASLMESRPDYYNHFIGQRSVLHFLLGKENTVTARFAGVMDNCAIDLFHVAASSSEGKIVLILYPDKDMMTNCICRYDVDFKINSHPLKTIFQHKVCTDKLYADSFYKIQKNSHSSFEVICCRR